MPYVRVLFSDEEYQVMLSRAALEKRPIELQVAHDAIQGGDPSVAMGGVARTLSEVVGGQIAQLKGQATQLEGVRRALRQMGIALDPTGELVAWSETEALGESEA